MSKFRKQSCCDCNMAFALIFQLWLISISISHINCTGYNFHGQDYYPEVSINNLPRVGHINDRSSVPHVPYGQAAEKVVQENHLLSAETSLVNETNKMNISSQQNPASQYHWYFYELDNQQKQEQAAVQGEAQNYIPQTYNNGHYESQTEYTIPQVTPSSSYENYVGLPYPYQYQPHHGHNFGDQGITPFSPQDKNKGKSGLKSVSPLVKILLLKKLLLILSPFLVPLPFLLALIPIAIPAIPLAFLVGRYPLWALPSNPGNISNCVSAPPILPMPPIFTSEMQTSNSSSSSPPPSSESMPMPGMSNSSMSMMSSNSSSIPPPPPPPTLNGTEQQPPMNSSMMMNGTSNGGVQPTGMGIQLPPALLPPVFPKTPFIFLNYTFDDMHFSRTT